jgi:hypothetical protein
MATAPALRDIAEYPVDDSELWLVIPWKVRGFLTTEDKQHRRPWWMLLYRIKPRSDLLDLRLVTNPLGDFPKSEVALELIESQVRSPSLEGARPHRPLGIVFHTPKLLADLAKTLTFGYRIPSRIWTDDENATFAYSTVNLLSENLRKDKKVGYSELNLKPGLVRSGIPKEHVASFFDGAAAFYKADLWRKYKPRECFTISWPGRGVRIAYLVGAESLSAPGNMMGLETSVDELGHMFKYEYRRTLDTGDGYHRTLVWTNEYGVPFDDLDDGDRFGWKVGAADYRKDACIPFPYNIVKDVDSITRPSEIELEWFEVACRAILKYTEDKAAGVEMINEKRLKLEIKLPSSAPGGTSVVFLGYWGHKITEMQKEWQNTELLSGSEAGKPFPKPEIIPRVIDFMWDLDECVVCGAKDGSKEAGKPPVNLKRCGNCKLKMYCGRECQRKHWYWHKDVCESAKKRLVHDDAPHWRDQLEAQRLEHEEHEHEHEHASHHERVDPNDPYA